MAFSLALRSSLCVIFFAFFLNSRLSSSQYRSYQAPVVRQSYRPPCIGLFKRCHQTTTTTTTEEPWWSSSSTTEEPWWTSSSTTEYYPSPIFPAGDKVNLLKIAETCAANFITQDYDENWEGRVDQYYDGIPPNLWSVRLTNKLFVYLMAFNMFQSNGLDITESQMSNACFVTNTINGWSITNTTGFGGKSVLLRLAKTNLPKVFRFTLPYGPLGASTGTASIILSDNNGYNVFEFCFDNGLRTFAMFARKLGDNDISAIKLHLKAIGFKDRHFIDLNPDFNCNDIGKSVLSPVVYDLPSPRPPSKDLIKFVDNNSLLPLPPFFWKKK